MSHIDGSRLERGAQHCEVSMVRFVLPYRLLSFISLRIGFATRGYYES